MGWSDGGSHVDEELGAGAEEGFGSVPVSVSTKTDNSYAVAYVTPVVKMSAEGNKIESGKKLTVVKHTGSKDRANRPLSASHIKSIGASAARGSHSIVSSAQTKGGATVIFEGVKAADIRAQDPTGTLDVAGDGMYVAVSSGDHRTYPVTKIITEDPEITLVDQPRLPAAGQSSASLRDTNPKDGKIWTLKE